MWMRFIIGQYWCSLCHLKFSFKSKLDRHLASEDHKMFASCVQSEVVDDENVEMMSPLCHDMEHDLEITEVCTYIIVVG